MNMARFVNHPTKEYLTVVSALDKLDHSDRAYAESSAKKKEASLIKKYGKKNNACFCRLFRNKCKPKRAECEFANSYGANSWRDHGSMYYDGQRYTFIGEPYHIYTKAIKELMDLSDKYDLKFTINAIEASWFPSQTLAIIVQKKLMNKR